MKKVLITILVFVIVCSFVGCATAAPKDEELSNYVDEEVVYEDIADEEEYVDVQYISDRRVQYDDSNARHIVFFGLKDAAGNYMSSSGIAGIKIIDDTNTILFQKDVSFTKSDFTDWTNQMWDSSRYLCGLYIKDSELQGSASSSGKLLLKVTLDDGTYFDEDTLSVYDLPSIQVKVNLPTIPATFTDSRYSSYTSTVQVTKLEYKSEVGYDGEATLYFEVILKLISKTDNFNESSNVNVGYKLYDSDGIVVDSGHIYSDPLAIGESSKDEFNIYDLDPRDTYTLKFENAS